MIAFRSLPSFEEYLLLDQTWVHGSHYAKTGRKRWAFTEYDEEDGAVKFETIPCEMSLAALYKHLSSTNLRLAWLCRRELKFTAQSSSPLKRTEQPTGEGCSPLKWACALRLGIYS